MNIKFVIASSLLAVASLGVAAAKWLPDIIAVEKGKREVASRMKDPDSVQFRTANFYKATGALCGSMNAKNSMGGYVGFGGFVLLGNGELRIKPDDETSDNTERQIETLRKQITWIELAQANCGQEAMP